jgi:hypothetical protein
MRREGRVTKVAVSIDTKVRVSIGLSEAALMRLLGLSLHTLKELKMKAKKSANLDSLRKLIFLFFFTVPFNSIAELSDYLIHFRTPGFLWYCVKADSNNLDDSEYDEELCQQHFNRDYSQDFVRIFMDQGKSKVESRVIWGRGRESNEVAFGFYSKVTDSITLNSFGADEWASADEEVDDKGFLINACEVSIKRRKNIFEIKFKSKMACKPPSNFLWVVKAALGQHK